MKYKEDDYLGFDPFESDKDDNGSRCQSVKLVKVRKPQECMLTSTNHLIQPGELARFEKAIFEGKWCSWYCCISCMDEWFEEIGLEPKDNTAKAG